MNLTGRWSGKYKYGDGYPKEVSGTTENFVIDIIDLNGNITGSCLDPVVTDIENNDAVIEGSFKDRVISFIKRYKYQSLFNDDGTTFFDPAVPSCDIHYTGRLYKRIFSRTPYFSGEWLINSAWTDENGNEMLSCGEGTWTMKKIS